MKGYQDSMCCQGCNGCDMVDGCIGAEEVVSVAAQVSFSSARALAVTLSS